MMTRFPGARLGRQAMCLVASAGAAAFVAPAFAGHDDVERFVLESGVTVELRGTVVDGKANAYTYAFVEPDGRVSVPAEQSTEIVLRAGRFDPLLSRLAADPGLRAKPGSELWLVQFQTSPRDEYRRMLEAEGARVMPGYINGQAWVVRMPQAVRDRVAVQPWVRWVGHVEPEMKLAPSLSLDRVPENETVEIKIQIAPPSVDAQARLVDVIKDSGGEVSHIQLSGTFLIGRVDQNGLRAVIMSDDCFFVSRYVEAKIFSADSRITAGSVYAGSNAGPYMGEGARINVNDSSYATDCVQMVGESGCPVGPCFPGLVNPVEIRYTPPGVLDSHGVRVYSVIFAPEDYLVFPKIQGSAPHAYGVFTSISAFRPGLGALGLDQSCVTRPLVMSAIDPVLDTPEIKNYRVVLENNSWGVDPDNPDWGDAPFNVYRSESHETDVIAFHYQHLMVHASGNSSEGLAAEAMAKNILTAGPLNIAGDPLDASVHRSFPGHSNGPADVTSASPLGRIKPDLVQPSRFVSVSGPGSLVPPQRIPFCSKRTSGTSFSAPSIAGCAGLVFEMWGKEHTSGSGTNIFRQPLSSTTGVPDTDVFANRPGPAVVKALLINTANPYDWNQDPGGAGALPNNSLNRGEQGWGRPDLRKLHTRAVWYQESNVSLSQCLGTPPGAIAPVMFVNPELTAMSTQGQVYTRCFEVTPTDTELRVTLVWSDPAPSPYSGGNPLVNDLDLEVIAPDQTTVYRGNHGLSDGIWSIAGGSADTTNNVENVFIPGVDLQPGIYELRVTLSRLNADGSMPVWTQCAPAMPPGSDGVDDVRFALIATRGPCLADYDQNGVVNDADLTAFVNDVVAASPRADANYDGLVNFSDVIAFQAVHGQGCP